MKILCFTTTFPKFPNDFSGAFVFESLNSINRKQNTIRIFIASTWKPNLIKTLRKDKNINFYQKKSFKKKYSLNEEYVLSIPRNMFKRISVFIFNIMLRKKIKKILFEYKPEIIHFHDYIIAQCVLPLAKELNIPCCLTIHGIDTSKNLQTKYFKNLKNKIFHDLDTIIVVGQILKKELSAFEIDENKIVFIPNGVNFPKTKKENKIYFSKQKAKIISVSNLHEGKGIDLNLKALKQLKNQFPELKWQYKIIGDGYQRNKLEKFTKKNKLEKNIKFLGYRKKNYVFKALYDSDIFLLPSYREAFGIAYLEAMAFGLITIGVKGQGPETFIIDSINGYLIPPKDVSSIKKVLLKILKNKKESIKLSLSGKKYIKENFTWEKHGMKLEDLYRSILRK